MEWDASTHPGYTRISLYSRLPWSVRQQCTGRCHRFPKQESPASLLHLSSQHQLEYASRIIYRGHNKGWSSTWLEHPGKRRDAMCGGWGWCWDGASGCATNPKSDLVGKSAFDSVRESRSGYGGLHQRSWTSRVS